jgi:DNA-binding SARP family transcriptional activator
MMTLRCFGYPSLEGPDGTSLDALQKHPKRFAVLIYLACQHRALQCQRESLLPVFWPDSTESQARNSLRQSLHVLRGIVGDGIINGRDEGRLSVDNTRFRSDVEAFRAARTEERLQDALNIHSEDFLADFYVPGADPFMAWVDRTRRTLRERAGDCAHRLARSAEADRDAYQSVAWWNRALELSPYDEEVITSLVWALVQSGNRGSAGDIYQRFRDRMMADLDFEPSHTTQASVERAMLTPALMVRDRPSPPEESDQAAAPPDRGTSPRP